MIVKNFIFCFMFMTNAFAQDILIGANGLIGIINTNSTAGVGLGINGEHRFASYPLSLRLSAKIYSASFDDSPYLRGYTHGLKIVYSI